MSDGTPHLLLVNPNANTATTRVMTALAQAVLTGTGLTARGATADSGPSVITGPEALAASVPHVLRSARRNVTADTVGIIVAAIGDPGVRELRQCWTGPVVGLGEASIMAAGRDGRRFGMVTSTKRLGPGLLGLVRRHAGPGVFTGLRFTGASAGQLAADDALEYRELSEAVRLCEQVDGAESVIVGGGPLSRTARRLADEHRSVVVEPVPSAVAHLLDALGLAARSGVQP
ncbi:MAG: aspartate/glutamate racemase family protein [Micropruina sp.]|uniref:aspartate/glutamate racemase family protein n=1 Tax=Micropruina sp. TaxID=2737536 RepID=UPI0039E257C7